MKNICVFMSSSNHVKEKYYDCAKELGKLIAQNDFNLVYGAGSVGLMYEVARNAQNNGAKVFGVIPKKLTGIGVDYKDCDKYFVTDCMRSRKDKMDKLSDAFIALAGGFGTLEEVLEIITSKQLGYHNKPIVFINTDGFYDDLLNQFEKFYDENFTKEQYKNLYFIASEPKEAIDYIKRYDREKTASLSKW